MKERINLYLDMITVLLIVSLIAYLFSDSTNEYYPISAMWILTVMGAAGLIPKLIIMLIAKIRKK